MEELFVEKIRRDSGFLVVPVTLMSTSTSLMLSSLTSSSSKPSLLSWLRLLLL